MVPVEGHARHYTLTLCEACIAFVPEFQNCSCIEATATYTYCKSFLQHAVVMTSAAIV